MRIRTAELAAVVTRPDASPPDDLPQVAVAGRSNVGKSSLLNAIAGRRALAPISKTPGRTRALHFYRINGRFYLVDLPGYGYARLPDLVRRRWRPLLEGYFARARGLRGVVWCLDARRAPTAEDLQMAEYLRALGLPTLYVLTKIDKLKRRERAQRTEAVLGVLGAPRSRAVWFSAKTGEGKVQVLKRLSELLREPAASEEP